jgi:pimeloyl-ACP methyl ester carboxylesterase
MSSRIRKARTLALLVTAVAVVCAALAPPALSKAAVSFKRIGGFKAAGTPAKYNKVGILRFGSKKARNVLVLNPGTSASAAYFAPLAKDVVRRAKGWQVWSVERRENLLEDHSVLNRVKAGKGSSRELFEYYLGFIDDPSVAKHFQFIPDSSVDYAHEWGMRTEIQDLHRVVKLAKQRGGKVVVGGHSLGGTITTAYATWDFNGSPGARGLSGLVYIDGGSRPESPTAEEAAEQLAAFRAGTPWLTFGGITAPFTGLFNATGSLAALTWPNEVNLAWDWPLLPSNLKPPVEPTNLAQYGYALDTETSPPGLAAAQGHIGRLAASGSPRGWEQAGEITPIRRFATMFSGNGLKGLDGTAWYHPQRLTMDSSAVAAGNANPAQKVFGVRAIHGDDLPRRLRIYAFGAALGGQRVLDAAKLLASQSGIPRRNLKLVERASTYSHNDPNSASPKNDFVKYLTPLLKKIGGR